MPNAFVSDLLQALLDRMVHRRGDSHIKSSTDKRQAQGLACEFRKLHANAAEDALAGFKNNSTGLQLLLKSAALAPKAAGVRSILFRVMLKQAVPGRAAIAMQTARCFAAGFRPI